MKLKSINKGIKYSVLLFALASSATSYAEGMKCCANEHGKFYVGVFGGWGSAKRFDVNQFGTAFYTEAAGGPLAVNAFGNTNSETAWLVGGHVGYRGAEIITDPCNRWSIVPAAELEGYYLDNNSLKGHVSNNTTRLPEHNFNVRYPMKTGVFLTNAVLSFNIPCLCQFHPYVGAGIGGAVIEVSNATATQLAPAEPGINHYNSRASDTAPTFAGQVKVGLNYDLTDCAKVFVEYRWLYLSSTHYSFGSTVYPGHPVTSNWQVKLDPQHYNLGVIGLQYSF